MNCRGCRRRFLPLPDLGRSKETLFAGYWAKATEFDQIELVNEPSLEL